MSIEKKAVAVLTEVKMIDDGQESVDGFVKLAARVRLDANSEAKRILDAEVQKHPTALFFKAKAIVADEMNSNGDYFSTEELIKAAPTFVGVPFYTNHENQDITKAKGKIVHAEWVVKDKAIYVIGFIDREAYPGLCRGVQQEYMTGVSMGCVVESSECSICGNTAATVEEYCPHIKFRKGRTFSGTVKHVKTGEIRNLKNALCFEFNRGVRFIELSGVGDPACKSCRIQGVIENDEYLAKAASCQPLARFGGGGRFLAKVASIENSVLMYRETPLYKQASQEELQQLDQVLSTLEQISIKLIQNRKRVEVEFASDLVKILSELQEFVDELTGAGYGQMQGDAGGIPGVDGAGGALPGGAAELPPPAEGVPSATGTAMPISDILGGDVGGAGGAPAGVGQVSGSPTKPVVRMPTPPKKPMMASQEGLQKVADLLATIRTALEAVHDENDEESKEGVAEMKRRIPTVASQERDNIQHVLSASMKGKPMVAENGNHGNTVTASGGVTMSQAKIVTADRTEAPGVLPEKQLDANLANHPRTGVEQNSTGEVQLSGVRTDSEPQTTTEDQIKDQRKDNTPGVLPEKQLAALRKDNVSNSTQQVQLEPNRTDTEQQSTTEKQLEDKPADLWSRSAMTRSKIKTEAQHAKAVLTALAEAAIRCSATPQQIRTATATLVADTKSRTDTLDRITSPMTAADGSALSGLSVAARAKYWGGKGITLASTTKADMASDVVVGLKALVAFDSEIAPEMVMDVLDVVSAEDGATSAISDAIDESLAAPQPELKAASANSRKKILAAIMGAEKLERLDQPLPPVTPRKTVVAAEQPKVRKPDHIIVATLAEVGTTIEELKVNKPSAKRKIAAFVAKLNGQKDVMVEAVAEAKDGRKTIVAGKVPVLKIANITNVTVDSKDGTVQIAIQTEEGETKADLELPLDDQGGDVAGAPAEGDATGEGLDNLLGGSTPPPAPAAGGAAGGAGTPPPVPAPNAPLPTASAKGSVQKTAQMGGGTGGGLPGGGPLGGGTDPNAAGGPAGMPAMDDGGGLQSFTDDKKDDKEEAPGVGEQMMPGSICPFCHGTDTTTGKKDLPPGAFECNGCGAKYEVHVNIEMLNPENASFEKKDADAEVVEPDLPELPVAASIKLDKGMMEKIASCESKFGHVCPACGMTECKPMEKEASRVVYICPSCETKTAKDVLVDMSDKSSYMQVEWVLNPNKAATAKGCDTCKQAAREYVAAVKVSRMMRKAVDAEKDPKTAFPMANCVEYVGRRWGANAVATNGPCKGKPLATCACNQLKTFALRSRRDIERLASVYAQPDPMEECLKLHVQKGYKQAQAATICDAMKAKYAKEADTNEWLEAFASDSRFTTEELRIMKQKSIETIERKAQGQAPGNDLDLDLGAPVDDVGPAGDDMVTVEIPKEVAADLAGQIDAQSEQPADVGAEGAALAAPELPEMPPAMAATKAPAKTAAAPNKVEDISAGVEGKLQGGKKTIGNEGKDNIDVPAAKPTIPSSPDGAKIKGEKQTIPEAKTPDIPKDNSLMGDEANTLKGTPEISLDVRGRVIAETGPEVITREAAKPKQVEDISVGVEGKVEGGKGTIGNEGKDNIDVAAKAPSIPTNPSGAKIDGEKQTIPEASLPDIPVDHSLIGGEKTTKGIGTDTPPISNDIRGRVIAKRDEKFERIAAARHKKACQVAAKLVGMGRIAAEDFDAVVEDLSKVETDRIEAFAERLYRAVKTASVNPPVTLATPIVQEASSYRPEMPKGAFEDLKGIFTIGTPQLSRAIEEEDRKASQQ